MDISSMRMSSRRPTRLEYTMASAVLHDHFGELVEKVGMALMKRGRQQLIEIVDYLQLSKEAVSNALLILMHHNCCTYTIDEIPGITTRTFIYYDICVDSIMMLNRMSKLLSFVQERFGVAGETILSAMLRYGRLVTSEVIPKSIEAHEEYWAERSKNNDNDELIPSVSAPELARSFLDMINARLLTQVKRTQEKQAESAYSTTAAKAFAKQGAKKEKEAEEEQMRKKQANEYHALFLSPASLADCCHTLDNLDEEEEEEEIVGRKRKKNRGRGKPKKYKASETKYTGVMSTDDDCIQWRINYSNRNLLIQSTLCSEFTRQFRNRDCTKYLEKKLGVSPALVMRFALDKIEPFRFGSDCFNFGELLTYVRSNHTLPGAANLLQDTYMQDILDDLCRLQFLAQLSTDAGDIFYRVRVMYLVDTLRLNTIENIVEEKYGQVSRRIFRLLLEKKRIEQKEVAEFALITTKEAKQRLYTLFEKKFITCQEIPKTSDHAPSRTIYLWTVDLNDVYRNITEQCLLSMRNLKLHVQHHTDMAADLIDRATYLKELTPSEYHQYQRLDVLWNQFHKGVDGVDNCLMLLRDYPLITHLELLE